MGLTPIDLSVIETSGYRCGSCHKPISRKHGVVFGRPLLRLPAINICMDCVVTALTLLSGNNALRFTGKEGKA